MLARSTAFACLICSMFYSDISLGRQATDQATNDMIAKIKEEGLERSQVMDTVSYLTDVYGPRLTGSPITKSAGEWTRQRLSDWGLENSHLEAWGPFGRGWTLETFTANMVEPSFSSIIGYPKAWSPSTPKTIRGEPILLDVSTQEDFDKYRGKLLRAIVMISPPRDVKALFEAPATRQTDESLLALANAEPGARRGRRPVAPSGSGGAPGGPASGGPANAATPPQAGTRGGAGSGGAGPDGRSSLMLQSDKWQFAYSEGAAVVIEPGRGDGGTVFVGSVTLPRRPENANRNPNDAGGARTARSSPWSPDAPEVLPQVVVSVEHYNRLARMLQKGAHPILEIDIGCRYYSEDLNSFNIIAEIPGTDLKDEIVMLGAHFDSWHAGTGATDNAIGCAVAMEAVRILKTIGVQPRRTIRIGLWTGEEQGLLGSRAYVAEHFGRLVPSSSTEESRGRGAGGGGDRARPKYELKAEHEKLSAYFNLDNGAGKIRGIYLQGNDAVRSTFRGWLGPFADMGASTVTQSNTGGTDHLSFDGVGLPGFQFIQDPLEYDTRTHHSSMDVYERVQADDAKQASIIMATFVYQTAMLKNKLPRKPLDGDVVTATTEAEEVPVPVPVAAPATTVTTP